MPPQADAPAEPARPPEPTHCAWALIDRGALGWCWARMRLPESVVAEHLVGDVQPPNTRPIVASRIAGDITSDRMIDLRGWKPREEQQR